MKALATICAAIALAGCGTMEPLTPQEAMVIMQMQQGQAANNAAMWQNMQTNPVFQRMPTPQPVYTPPPRQIQCTTTGGMYSLYTTCR